MRIKEVVTGAHLRENLAANDEESQFTVDLRHVGEHPTHPRLPQAYIDWNQDSTHEVVNRWPNAVFATDEERDNPEFYKYPEMMLSPELDMPDPRFQSPGGIANDNRRLPAINHHRRR